MSSMESSLLPLRHPSRAPSLSLLLSRFASTSQQRGSASVLVRETAARELDERRADWGYAKPVVALDVMWKLAFVIVSAVVLICTGDEKPNVPIRVWLSGYSIQCLVHVFLVLVEYKRRNARWHRTNGGVVEGSESENEEGNGDIRIGALGNIRRSSTMKRCESLNTVASFLWWIIGFYWVVSGSDILLNNAPRLYWLSVVFLAFDVFFAIFCLVLACLIGIALCCCLPCIIAILCAIAGQEGASDADLSMLPKYRFKTFNKDETTLEFGPGKMIPYETTSVYSADERILLPEDAECCICLCEYEDGQDLNALPCNHHFHSACIVKWLKMNATCPLCKFNIIKHNDQV